METSVIHPMNTLLKNVQTTAAITVTKETFTQCYQLLNYSVYDIPLAGFDISTSPVARG